MHKRVWWWFAAFTVVAVAQEPRLELISRDDHPVLTVDHPDAAGNRYGFEGGRVVKVGSNYHLFTSEMVGDPIWVKMKLGYWRSGDGVNWKRISTLFESSGEFKGNDPRAALWSPLPVWDDGEGRWNLFYVAYRSARGDGEAFLTNQHGEIWRAVSQTRGREGIGGPYKDAGVVMRPGPDADKWEGLQGTDSFFPYRIGSTWYALYGSAKTDRLPIEYWQVGMAHAPRLEGPWTRMTDLNPVPIEKVFIENPIVTPVAGGYLCVYDSDKANAIGYAFSEDGIHWNAGHALPVQPKTGAWSYDVRTPLGLVPEGRDEYTVFYTGFEAPPDWDTLLQGNGGNARCAIGRVRLRLVR